MLSPWKSSFKMSERGEKKAEHRIELPSNQVITAKLKDGQLSLTVEQKVIESGEKTCRDCQINFDTFAKLKYHRLRAHGKWKENVACEFCSKTFATKSNLKKHVKLNHDPGDSSVVFKCDICDYEAKDSTNLKVHKLKHTGERPFECEKCRFGFYKNSDLKLHSRTCKGVKYQCKKCDAIFHFQRQLKEHLVWSDSCGTVSEKAGHKSAQPQSQSKTKDRYMTSKPSMIKVKTNDMSVVGVNCDSLIDESLFFKRQRRSKCGLCSGCERTTNCKKCKGCSGKVKKKQCQLRKCLNLVDHYVTRKEDKETPAASGARHVLQRFTSVNSDVTNTSYPFLDQAVVDLEHDLDEDELVLEESSVVNDKIVVEDILVVEESVETTLAVLADVVETTNPTSVTLKD